MIFWILIAVLTAGVAGLLIAPLMKPRPQPTTAREDEAAVYRDQMKEIDRDLALGLLGEKEADYARAEIGRRLLAATDAPQRGLTPAALPRPHRITTLLVILCPPIVGLAGYLMLGSPGMPDQPLAARLANPGNNIELLIAKAERHLAQNPNDGAGWDLLAPIYMRSGRFADADQAFRNSIRILGATPQRLAGLGETMVAANQGIVTDEARGFFEKAVELEPGNMRSRFYVALGLEQAGRKPEALAAFNAIKRDSPPGAAWESLVNQHIAANSENAPGNPSAADVAAAQNLSGQDRQAMIAGMVESLAERLKSDPKNIEGWLRLVRSYMVLGREQDARNALQTGLKTFPAETDEGQRLVALAREIGLGEGIVQ
ncbi:c-type cytochrome biogenesis protein CcmI [Rhizobium lemnae]|uniref:C-type cytochrome biogenesis protein CcmI n=1 Tax=Rhizobium lemnae TaxID=1214924 RepID=A0ABV8E569_9HYPH|nr:c-type cytochrome biogenesis protein CcmI [Rhizobium lemnae]MCJ8507601.1 c-type cytochrome biogenesis protein CcmI [Rhizobium lemnae]